MKLVRMIMFFVALVSFVNAQDGLVSKGPDKGTLIIVGGGFAEEILDAFFEAAGGKDANIVCIPTASGQDDDDQSSPDAQDMQERGATHVTVLHTNNRERANSVEFTKPLENATGVWFGGGRQWRLVDAYKNTRTEKMIRSVLDRGGVIGGTSAGATIQGSYLARGDTQSNQIMMGDHEEGFGYLANTAIDQHVLARNRHFDMFDILKNRPELLGISIDEGTAILVHGNEFKVIGSSYVLVYDGSFWSKEGIADKTLPDKDHLFYFLKKGNRYDLVNRQVIE